MRSGCFCLQMVEIDIDLDFITNCRCARNVPGATPGGVEPSGSVTGSTIESALDDPVPEVEWDMPPALDAPDGKYNSRGELHPPGYTTPSGAPRTVSLEG